MSGWPRASTCLGIVPDNWPVEPDEEVLAGGNVAARVVRVGQTVRKPAGLQTPAVEAFLAHLNAVGLSMVPRTLGRDDSGRHVIEYVPGALAHSLPPLDPPGLHRVGRMIRDLHDASESFRPSPAARWTTAIPPDRDDLICHHDLAPWNMVIDGDRWVFIDWDGAGPGSRLWDLAYAIKGFVPLEAGRDPAADGTRMRALADGYRLARAQRQELVPLLGVRTRAMHDLLRNAATTGRQPWARLYAEGHGEYWGQSATYVETHQPEWARALR
jgi:Ser/Thr protein kinase RdoA (MazF antagonist)